MRKALIATGLLSAFAVGIYPPWEGSTPTRDGEMYQDLGHALLLDPPYTTYEFQVAHVRWPRLALYWILIALGTGAIAVLTPARRREQGTGKSSVDLDGAVVHVGYEMAAMRAAAIQYRAAIVDRRFLLEAFLVHVRNLREFFWNKSNPKYPDDVLAEHYFESPVAWRGVRGAKPDAIERTRDAIHRQMAHITVHRGNPSRFLQLEQEMGPLERDLNRTWGLFLKGLAVSQRLKFEDALAAKTKELFPAGD